MMKVGIFTLVLLNFFSWIYLIAFLFFDSMYFLVEQYSFRIKVYSISRQVV